MSIFKVFYFNIAIYIFVVHTCSSLFVIKVPRKLKTPFTNYRTYLIKGTSLIMLSEIYLYIKYY